MPEGLTKGKYVRKAGTGEVFINTMWLDIRDDMHPYDGPLPWEHQEEKSPSDTGGKDKDDDNIDPNKVIAIVDVIAELSDGDYTRRGLPRVDRIEEILGFDVTMAERDEAWRMFSGGEK